MLKKSWCKILKHVKKRKYQNIPWALLSSFPRNGIASLVVGRIVLHTFSQWMDWYWLLYFELKSLVKSHPFGFSSCGKFRGSRRGNWALDRKEEDIGWLWWIWWCWCNLQHWGLPTASTLFCMCEISFDLSFDVCTAGITVAVDDGFGTCEPPCMLSLHSGRRHLCSSRTVSMEWSWFVSSSVWDSLLILITGEQ